MILTKPCRVIWTTRDGQRIPIGQMTDSHLTNTIAYIYRRAAQLQNEALVCYPCFQGEMAQMYAEQEWDALNEMDSEDFAEDVCPQLPYLLAEQERRRKLTTQRQ